MQKIIFFSDTHLGIDMPLKPKKDRRRRGPDYFKNFKTVINYAIANRADLLIHGGDLFDTPKVHQHIVDLAYEQLFKVADNNIPVVICPGNHERSKLPVSLYLNHQNIYVFTKPQVFSFKLNRQLLNLGGFPYTRKVKHQFPDIIKEVTSNIKNEIATFNILLMHQAIEGAVVGPHRFRFKQSADVVQIKAIPNSFDLILSGHIHPTQMLKTTNGTPILYAGSTERTAFAEKDEPKGFYEVLIKDNAKVNLRFVELDTRPMVVIRLNEDFYSEESLRRELTQAINNLNAESVIQIRLKNQEFSRLLNVRLLDEIIPKTMNYQIAGMGGYYQKQVKRIRKN